VIDVSTPSNPQKVSFYSEVTGLDIYVSDPYAYIVFHWLHVIDVSEPSNPQEAGYYTLPEISYGVYVSGPYVYVADGDAGLQIYENLLLGVEEEPFSIVPPILLTTSLNRFSYDVPGQAQLTLYSADGRKVHTETIEGKGTWDAPTDLPKGVYFALVLTEDHSARTKLVVLR
jgi:hypothetical protein